jgi:hypothetical protein
MAPPSNTEEIRDAMRHSLKVVSYAKYGTPCVENGNRQPTNGCEIGMCIAMVAASDDAAQFSHEMRAMRLS